MSSLPRDKSKKRQTPFALRRKATSETPGWVYQCIASPQEGVRAFLQELCNIGKAPYAHLRILSRSGKFYKLAESIGPYKKIGWQRRSHLLDKRDGESIYYQFIDYKTSKDCEALKNKFEPSSPEWKYLNSLVYGFWIPLMLKNIELGYVTLSWDREPSEKNSTLEVSNYIKNYSEYIPLVYQASRNLIADNFLSELWSDSSGILSATNEYECYKHIADACIKLWGEGVTVYIGKIPERQTHIELVALKGKKANEVSNKIYTQNMPLNQGIFGWLFNNKEPLLTFSLAGEKRYKYLSLMGDEKKQGSVIAARISNASGDDAIALLSIEHDLPNYFDYDDIRYISGIARIGYENISAHRSIYDKTSRNFDALYTGIAHDIIEPLQAMVADAEILKIESSNILSRSRKSVDIDKYLLESNARATNFLEEAFNLHRTMRGYLDKGGEGRSSNITTGIVRIYPLLNALVDQWRPRAENQGIQIRTLYDSLRDIRISCDEAELKSILGHLMGNAIKYSFWGKMKKQGDEITYGRYIKIRARVKVNIAVIEIENFGIGILNDEIKRVTEKYYRGKLAIKEGKSGTGRGLWTVNNFLTSINGYLEITSIPTTDDLEGPYSNSFFVHLPIYSPKENENG